MTTGLTESDLTRAHRHTPDSVLEAERVRPGPARLADYHYCVDCKLVRIPDTKTAVLCQFCWRSRIIANDGRSGRMPRVQP